ncbi:Spore maturation protein B [bioreactor metagenome]|uniref:Spore maturation protein B n=1 Tax=bioreactor metagenome TaxID=1076179 RepID=A0A645DE10_9ZZZZ
MFKGVKVFDCFLEGAKSGLKTVVSILPSLVGLIVAVTMLRVSGGIDLIGFLVSPIAKLTGIPQEVIPLAVLNPVSGGASLSMFEDILKTYGPDSYVGMVASVMMGATETTFYAVTVYYGAINVKKTRHTIPAAVAADFTSFILSALFVRIMYFN